MGEDFVIFRQVAGVALATIVSASAAWAADFDPNEFASSQIIRSGGFTVDIPGKGSIVILDVEPNGDAKADCMVHVPSIQKAILADPDGFLGLGGGRNTIWLDVEVTLDSEIYCVGKGRSCKVTFDLEK